VAIWAVEQVNRQVRSKLGDLRLPLCHDRLWYDNESPRNRVGYHSRHELDGLSQAHLVTEKPAWVVVCALTRQEPLDALALVLEKATLESHGRVCF